MEGDIRPKGVLSIRFELNPNRDRAFSNFTTYKTRLGKPESKRPQGRPRRRWVDNIKMDLREIGWDDVDWIDLAQDRNQ
jgi:hypothetical protein